MIYDLSIFYFNENETNQKDIKLVFVHIPKTAGTSIEHVLENNFNDGGKDKFRHSNVREIVQKSEINLEDYKVLTVVRNTFDRIFSTWRWYCIHKCHQPFVADSKLQKVTFKEYVLMIKKYFNGEIKHIKGHQARIEDEKPCLDISHIEKFEWWMQNAEGKLVEYDALRFENLDEEWDNYKHKLCIKEQMVHLNGTPTFANMPLISRKEVYDKETYEIISEIYKSEIERFNYE